MKQLDVWLDDDSLGPCVQVGSLIQTSGRGGDAVRFEYAQPWLDGRSGMAPFELDPELPLHAGPQHTAANGGASHLHRIFRDTSPDRWGRVLMERREAQEARDEARRPRRLREWDFLAGVSDDTRMGALRLFEPEALHFIDDREQGAPPITRLRELEDIAARLDQPGSETRREYRQWLRQLVLPGTSLGGSRPKASFVREDGALWLAKFPGNDDRHDVGLWESLLCTLARSAGVDVPESHAYRFSARGHTFAAQRFDRVCTSRRLYASAMTLLQQEDGDGGSYLDIVQAIEHYAPVDEIDAQLEQLYRRVLFSILVGNRDDHLRNHGFLRTATGWRLAPAFDINPNPDKDVHALAIDADDPAPSSGTLRQTAAYYRLSAARAERIGQEVRAALSDWQRDARQLGLPAIEIDLMQRVIDPQR